jgi:FkbM family methyltransferase
MKMIEVIPKYQTLYQQFQYTRFFRAPLQLLQKLKSSKRNKPVKIRMRLGHEIELVPTQPYLERVVFSRSYHDDGVFFLKLFLGQQPVIIDIGANIGLLSCAYAQVYKKLSPKIFAIEAVEQNYLRLVKNIELNHFTCIKPFRLAFGKENGSLTFKLPSKEFTGNAVGTNVLSEADRLSIDSSSTYEEIVSLTTLDSWANEQKLDRCDFIKIDVEGAELFVFEGGRQFITKTRPLVQAEFNGYWLEQQRIGLKDYLKFFSALNYVCFVDDDNSFRRLKGEKLPKSLVDLLFVPEEKLNLRTTKDR